METYIFQHVEFEGPGAILSYLKSKGHRIHIVKLYAGDKIPQASQVDFAVLMGGPMSVLEEKEYPYFVREKEFCREMVQLQKPILGICLGAQMIARALGAAIRKNPEKEIGWFPVEFKNEAETVTAFHWHGETFGIPEGAEAIASSAACKNQGFRLGSALGLQFHLETTAESEESILRNCEDELNAALRLNDEFVQNSEKIRKLGSEAISKSNEMLFRILDEMLEKK